MRGKLIEDLLFEQCVAPAVRTTAVTLYNGSLISVSGNGINTSECDEINFVINAGTFVGAATLNADVIGSNTNDPSVNAALLSGRTSPNDAAGNATFTTITTANDARRHAASIKSKNFPKWMWLRTYQTADTTNYSALAIKGKCDRNPQINNPVFDLNY